MAAGHQPSPASAEPAALDPWLQPLQQVLEPEAARGFANLKGRPSGFSAFQACLLYPADPADE